MFTKKITLSLMLLATVCFSTANAQSSKTRAKAKDKNAGEIEKGGFIITKVHVDNPEELNNVMININPLISDVSFTNASYKLGLDASYRMGKTFALSMNANRAIYDFGANDAREKTDENGDVLNPATNSSQVEFSGTFFFANKESKVDVNHYVHSETKGRLTTKYFVKFPTTRILLHGIKLGYNRYTSIAGNGMNDITFKGKDVTNNDAAVTYFSEDSNSAATAMVSSNIITIGYNAHWLCNIKFNVKGHGERGVSTSLSFFGDLLYAPSISIADYAQKVYINYEESKMVTYNLNDHTDKRSLGFRIGAKYHFHEMFGKLNTTYGGELGVRPGVGPMASGIYAMASLGIGLGFDAK